MLKNLFYPLRFLILLPIFFSCSPDEQIGVQKTDISEAFASKSSLLSLSPEEQKQAWIKRLNMYFNLELSLAQKDILKKLIYDLQSIEEGSFYISTAMKEHAIEIAKVTPKEDFLRLFSSEAVTLDLPNLIKKGPICVECIVDLQNYVSQTNPLTNIPVSSRAEDCDCLWTCEQQLDNLLCDPGQTPTLLSQCTGGTQTTPCCSPTSGCGLFLLQTCTGKAACLDE